MAAAEQLIAEGLAFHQAGRLAEAASRYAAAIERVPGHPDALHLLGLVAYQRGAHDQAVALIGQAIARDDASAIYHANLGEVLLGAGRPEAAGAAFGRAIERAPSLAGATNGLAVALKRGRRPGPARRAAVRAIALAPGFAEAWVNLGNLDIDGGDERAAVAHYRRAIAAAPGYAGAWRNLGNARLSQRDAPAARACFAAACRLEPASADLHAGAMAAALLDEDHDAVLRAGRRAIALRPGLEAETGPWHQRLAWAAFALGDDAAAAGHHRRSRPDAGELVAVRVTSVAGTCRDRRLPYRRLVPARTVAVPTGSAQARAYSLPARFVARVDDAIVLGDHFSVVAGDRLLADGLEPYSAEARVLSRFIAAGTPARALVDLPAAPERFAGEAVLFGGDRNFSHGVLDWCSKLMALAAAPDIARLPIVASPGLSDGMRRLAGFLGRDLGDARWLAPEAALRVDRLWIPSLAHRYQWIDPAHLARLRQRLGVPSRPGGRRLYLSRAGAAVRRVVNEPAVIEALVPLGVEVVRPETMGIDAQIALFGAAEAIVMPLGGGSAAIAFAPPGAVVVELTHDLMLLDQYPIIAAHLRQPYGRVTGRPVANPTGINFDWDFEVDPGVVARRLRRLLAGRD